jgi:hypothetical protein
MAQHFYDGQIRRYITQVIRLMSNFYWKDSEGSLKQIPVLYGDLTRQVASIIKENSENKLISVPRMAVYMTNLEMDRTRTSDSSFVSKVHIRERAYDSNGTEYLNEQGKNYTVERLMPTPYNLTINVDIWSSNTDQKLQIVEQILMLFNPSLEIQTTDNFIDWTSLSVVNLENINLSNRTVPVGAESEIDIATLTFSTPIYISPPAKVKRLGIITNIITNIFNEASGTIELDLDGVTLSGYSENDYTVSEAVTEHNTVVDRGKFPNDGTGEEEIETARTVTPLSGNRTTWSTTYRNYGIYVSGDTAQVVEKGSVGIVNWRVLLDSYPGTYRAGISQIKLKIVNSDAYVIGYITLNTLDETKLTVNWDTDTLPSNTVIAGPARNPNSYTTIDYIIDPLRWNPQSRLTPGLRILLLGKIGHDDNEDGADGWKSEDSPFSDLVADENDIVEWDGNEWQIVFDASANNEQVIYTANLNTGIQYKWTGEYWIKSYEGEYSGGAWILDLNG